MRFLKAHTLQQAPMGVAHAIPVAPSAGKPPMVMVQVTITITITNQAPKP